MTKVTVDLSRYEDPFTFESRLKRLGWYFFYIILFRPFSLNVFNSWRILILKIWGAKIGDHCLIYSNVKIWAPWNLVMKSYSLMGPNVDCYNQGKITIGSNTVISQKTYLCASSHDISNAKLPLTLNPIIIGNQVWVAADAFIGPDVNIGEGSVIGARAAVFKDVEPWTVVGGNPAKFIKNREFKL
jgi:putative colanic acid biosynthesis acetyltransferase WcaF